MCYRITYLPFNIFVSSLLLTLWVPAQTDKTTFCIIVKDGRVQPHKDFQVLKEERDVNSVLLNAWDWWWYLVMDSLLNQCIKFCDHKDPFENWSLTRKTDTGDVGCFLLFLCKKIEIVGIKVILHDNQGKAKFERRCSSVLFSKDPISNWTVFELYNAKRVSWGHAWKEESAAIWYSWLFPNVS